MAAVAAGLAALVVGTGIWLSFRYRPDATGLASTVPAVHAIASVALAVVTVIGLAAFVWERRPDRRHGLPAFAVVAAVGLVLVVEYAIGSGLAWDQLALWAVTPATATGAIRGVWLDGIGVKFVIVGTSELGTDELRRMVWLHLVVFPVLVGLGIGFVVGWTRHFARPEKRPARDGG